MTGEAWFRRTRWSPSNRADFQARLARSRSAGARAQYLRIQALHLQQIGSEPMYEAALELLDQLLADYPMAVELSEAHAQRAECLAGLGRTEEALQAFRAALEVQRRFPYSTGLAHIKFAELAFKLRREELFTEALAVLDEFGGKEFLPAPAYRFAAAYALLSDTAGNRSAARHFARAAIVAASATKSGLHHRPELGLVTADPNELSQLWRLANNQHF